MHACIYVNWNVHLARLSLGGPMLGRPARGGSRGGGHGRSRGRTVLPTLTISFSIMFLIYS